MGLALVLAIRLTAPLLVLRWPFAGAIAAVVADAIDIVIFQLTDFPGIGYQRTDKLLDVYYISLQAFVALRWEPLPLGIAVALYVYRMIGVLLYEITGVRVLLFIFPNLFEFFFLFYAGVRWFSPGYSLTGACAAFWLAVLLVPKMAQEYMLHYAKWLDDLVAIDIIRDVIEAVLPGDG